MRARASCGRPRADPALADPGSGEIDLCAARRHGLARRLLGLVEGEARNRQAGFLALWTDTRFEAAHAFDKAHGFRQTGLRKLDDASHSVEYGFRKEL